jgi:hypothetical protein
VGTSVSTRGVGSKTTDGVVEGAEDGASVAASVVSSVATRGVDSDEGGARVAASEVGSIWRSRAEARGSSGWVLYFSSELMAVLVISATVSVAVVKIGGDSFHPIGMTKGRATN